MPALATVLAITLLVVGMASLDYIARRESSEAKSAPIAAAVYFTPGDQTTTAVENELNAAKQTVHSQAYSFTSAPIAKALVDAERRGVAVVAVLDRSNRDGAVLWGRFPRPLKGCRPTSMRNTPSRIIKS